MRTPPALAALLLGTLGAAAGAWAADEAAGKAKAVVCQACHGAEGISPNDAWPNLAGQKRGYLVAQLKAYRDRKRIDESMQLITRQLSDADIENLASYYSGLR